MEKKKCILYGFAVLSALTGITFAENLSIFGEGVDEEPIAIVETGATIEQLDLPLNNEENDNETCSLNNEESMIISDVPTEDDKKKDQHDDNLITESNNNQGQVGIDSETDNKLDMNNDIDQNVSLDEIRKDEFETLQTSLSDSSVEDQMKNTAMESNEDIVAPYAWIDNQYGYGCIENNKLVFYLNYEKYTEVDFTDNSWLELNVNGNTIKYYIKDNQLIYGIETIDGVTYYFENGELVTNAWNVLWDNDTETNYGIYSGADGSLQKGWVTTEYNKYYFENNYKGLSGIQVIDGKTFYLDYGKVMNNYVVIDNDIFYYFGADGVANKQELVSGNQWIKIDNDFYYVKDKQLVPNQLLQIGNDMFGFDYNGKMYRNTDFWMNDDYYRASESGALIKGWYQPEGYVNTYYYGSDYKLVKGVQTIDGKTYVFTEYNGLAKNSIYLDDDTQIAYIGDEKGFLIGTIDCQKNGWIQQSGNWYYVENNLPVENGIKTINNNLYAFYNYKMIENKISYTYGYDNGDCYDGMVKAKPGGALVTLNWGSDGYNTYYFGANGLSVKGLQKIGNDYYYFEPDYSGRLAKNTIVNVEGVKWIRVDNSGKQIASFTTETNGWKNVSNGDWVYVENNEIVKDILKNIGNFKYKFYYNGLMYRNILYYDSAAEISSEKNNYLYFANNGASARGWVNSNDEWYYFDDDFYGITGIRTINNIVYAFNNLSAMRTKVTLAAKDGTVYSFDAKGVGTKVSPSAGFYMNQYYIDSNHKAVSGWHYINNSWYYFDPDTKEMAKLNYMNTPITTIGKKSYVFDYDGKMLTGWVFDGNSYARADGSLMENGWLQINGSWYYFKNSRKQVGAIIDTANNKYVLNKKGNQYKLVTQSNGWIDFQGEWYYLDNGKFVVGNSKIINGQTYGFDNNGFMVKNTEYLAYYFNKDGHAIKNQWLEVRPKAWRYYDEDGIFVANEWKTIGNSKYYFGSNGIAKTSDAIIDGELCKFSSSGALVGTPTKVKNGWNLVDGYWYYSNNGTLYEYGLYTIGSNDYFFQNGRMKMGEMIYFSNDVHYYANKDGSIAKNRWCGPQSQYYAQSDGNLKTGLITSGGKQYYIDSSSYAYIKDTSVLDSKENMVYIADKSGAISQILDAKTLNGWVKASNNAYYLILNHKFVTGTYESGNKLYWMNPYSGIMVENTFIHTTYDCGYADATGSITRNGWFNNAYCINGKLVNGPSKIDGKDYYFDPFGFIPREVGGTGGNTEKVYKGINGLYYYFDGKGNKKQITFKDGWNQYNGEWYYVGDITSYGLEKVNNVYYSFDNVGKMLTNQLVFDKTYSSDYTYDIFYYVDENGNLAKGWRYINNQWYYFGDNYQAVTGIRNIDGKEYIFNNNGVML